MSNSLQSSASAPERRPPEDLQLDRNLAFSDPLLQEACDYWRTLADARPMPARADIDPARMLPFLPHVTLFDVLTGDDDCARYRFRLQGTAMAAIFGEHTGRLLGEAFSGRRLQAWQRALDVARQERLPLRTYARLMDPARTWLIGENLIAPLSGDGARVDMVFCVMVCRPEEAIGKLS